MTMHNKITVSMCNHTLLSRPIPSLRQYAFRYNEIFHYHINASGPSAAPWGMFFTVLMRPSHALRPVTLAVGPG